MEKELQTNNPLDEVRDLFLNLDKEENFSESDTDSVNTDEPRGEVETEINDESRDEETVDNDAIETDADSDADEDSGSSDDLVDTINDLAEELDIPVSDFYQLNVKLGEDKGSVTLGQLKDFYESNQDVETVRAELQNREAEVQRQLQAAEELPNISAEAIEARAEVLAIQSQFNSVDWEGLRRSDPGQYAALQSDIRATYEAAVERLNEAQSRVKEQTVMRQKMEQDKLFAAKPELKDDNVRLETLTNVKSFIKKYGFTDEDFNQIADSRLMRLLIDVSKVSNAQETIKTKKVTELPKTQKTKSVSTRKASLKRLTDKAKRTGNRRDQIDAVAALLDSRS